MWRVRLGRVHSQIVMRLKSSVQLLSAIALISTLSLMTGVPVMPTASALPVKQPTETLKRQNTNGLPRSLNNRIRRDVSRRAGIPAGQLRIVRAERRTWNNGCLELQQPGEGCTRGAVSGWLVEVAGNTDRWIYHTDAQGRQLRLATADRPNRLPSSVSEAVLKDIVRRSNVPQSSLRVLRAQERTWNDGCLGLADPGMFCTQALVPGWHIQVEGKTQRWIYRTNQTGSVVKLEREVKAKNDDSIKSVRISDRDLPETLETLEKGVLFRAIASGGFTGQTSETLLMSDGQVLHQRVNFNGTPTPIRRWHISPQQLQQFQALLNREGFDRFDRLSYPATPGSADFLTVTLSTPTGTVQYADTLQSHLPHSLQSIIQAWNTLQ